MRIGFYYNIPEDFVLPIQAPLITVFAELVGQQT